MSAAIRHLSARVRSAAAAEAVLGVLDGVAHAVSAFETAPDEWRLDAYPKSPLLNPDLAARLALAAAAAGGELISIAEERLPDRDWLVENQLAFPPLRTGRFFIYGSHYRGPVPAAKIGIALDAAAAFGTGEHPSTRGCLMALEILARRRRIAAPLDIGAGTGILSIAAAKLLRRPVWARDIDPGAVAIARHNIARNGVARLVQADPAPGYRGRGLRRGRHDLIMSNILARPLALLAVDLARALAPGGRAVLSGLLRGQEPIVLAAHRGLGINLERRIVIGAWSTLVLRGGVDRHMKRGAAAPIYRLSRRLASSARPLRPPVVFQRRGAAGQPAIGPPEPIFDRRPTPRGSASDGCRYRPRHGRREPSDRHRRAAGAASRKGPSRPS